jgi:hypothetical protein
MSKARRQVYIKELVQDDHRQADMAFINLRKHLKAGAGSPFQIKPNYVSALYEMCRKNERAVSETRAAQWRILFFTAAMLAAVVASIRIMPISPMIELAKLIVSAGALVVLSLVYVAANSMMYKTNEDLDLLAEYARVNEEMQNATLGLPKLIDDVVASRRPEYKIRLDFAANTFHGKRMFTAWLNRILAGAYVLALVIAAGVVWL